MQIFMTVFCDKNVPSDKPVECDSCLIENSAQKNMFSCVWRTQRREKNYKFINTHHYFKRCCWGKCFPSVLRQMLMNIYIKSCSNATPFFCNFLWSSKRMPEYFSSHVVFYNATAAQMPAPYARLFKPDPTDYHRMIFKAEDRNCYRPPRQPVTAHCELRGFEFSHLV